MRHLIVNFFILILFIFMIACDTDKSTEPDPTPSNVRTASASYPVLSTFSSSNNSSNGAVYEVLPGPAVMNPAMNPTPFSDNINMTTGSYSFTVVDTDADDSQNSQDAVTSVNIMFTGSNGTQYKIDNINIIHKAAGTGDHTFYGGVGLNKMMHGNTGIGIGLMPKMFSYITLWGTCDLKNALNDTIIASNRMIHLMTASRVRDDNLKMIASAADDSSDYNFWKAETHIILPPQDTQGNMDPVPGTAHGFLHMMFEEVELSDASRDWTLAFEVLPGPAAINPAMNPTPFSNRVAMGAGTFLLKTKDLTTDDSENSQDIVEEFSLSFERTDGTVFNIDGIDIIHKAAGSGDHTFFGGVGFDKEMHGNTAIGTDMMPKMLSYITLWGTADLKDGNGNIVAANRMIHIMISSRARTDNLDLITDLNTDQTDHGSDKVEAHIILPPQDMQGNMDPVPGTGHGFLHLMFEKVTLQK